MIATTNHSRDLNELFYLRNQHNTECLVALSALANEMRVYHPMLVKEAGEPMAPETTYMAGRILDTLNRIDASQERYIKASQKISAGSISSPIT